MSPLVNRGRWIFLILATLIVLDRSLVIVVDLFSDPFAWRSWKAILLPGLTIYGIISLWQGDEWWRKITIAALLLNGGVKLLFYGWIIARLAFATPPAQTMAFFKLTTMLFGALVIYSGFYVFAALALFFSPSLQAFFAHQRECADNPWGKLTDPLLRPFNMDRSSRSLRKFYRYLGNRPRYLVLTRETLESLDDSNLVEAIVDYVGIKIRDGLSDQFQIVSTLPRGMQAVYSTYLVTDEVEFGSFHQFFDNKGINFAFMALEGYKLFGASELAELMARAIDAYLRDEPDQLSLRPKALDEMLEKYVEARNFSSLPDLERLFYQLDNDDLAVTYIRAHLDEFVGR